MVEGAVLFAPDQDLADPIRRQGSLAFRTKILNSVQDETFDTLKVISQGEEEMGFEGVQQKGSVQSFIVKGNIPFRG
jgi:hypothetical protein